MLRLIPLVVYCLVVISSYGWANDPGDAKRATDFEQTIRPALVSHCIQCHGEKKQEGGLRLDTREGLLSGGDSGPAVIAGKIDESLLVDAIRHNSLEMPPGKKLSDKMISQFESWIGGGAFWPDTVETLRESDSTITEEDRQWWAFRPLKKSSPRIDEADHWSQNEVDRFVWNSLRQHDLHPAPQADRETLVRRLYFNLIGLPPTPSEIESFVNDQSPFAIETVVDRLLNDHRYGEHWARFWLDLVRYSESDGWNRDAYRPDIWRYRDYVVDAFNKDMSYPQFVMDQLAGDEVADYPTGLVAAGFLRLGIYEYNQRDARGQWNDIMNEKADVAGDVFFGLSISCARCHQHKFDPIPQRDYFKLRAYFEPVVWRDDLVSATDREKQEHQLALAEWEKATEAIRGRLAELLEPYEKKKWASTVDKFPLDIQACFHMPPADRTSWQDQMAYLISRQYMEEAGGPYAKMSKEDVVTHKELLKELEAFDSLKPAPLPTVMTATDFEGIASPTINPDDPQREPVPAGFLEVLSDELRLPSATYDTHVRKGTTGRRTALAKWIGSPNNPLTNRVIVNRIWQQHFGRGIVETSNDFGRLGDAPTHPELLDWLTATFIENNWSFKELHRIILLSATWQQSAQHPQAVRNQSIDPAERLLWRARVRRLQAEQIRDAMLAVTEELEPKVGGPSVDDSQPRRSLYLKSFRNQNDTFLHGFDIANGLQSVATRDTTTTPLQSLLLFNGEFASARAHALAKRLSDGPQSAEQTLRYVFQSIWGTEPNESDLESAIRLVHLESTGLADLIHVLFNSSRFLYLE